ncbi:16S rRNA (uracil(1498)-N(3))-methyltransferase [Pseudofrankia sp. BMG5.36]|uniref:16S rRNA (uracil(1498)-N(3))-methyltransferase n=1 Tax=Pseudofrankia sp. BMG5.36 TaxID=1834512 RepID=UPI0008DAF6EF|nr:16S rRNA (uracil(1498)-N(3))-methyltransferase [Pseudofrankia sp. BMG5.36]OHV65774.1 16S rRNA (uracil(1498)-N(3))-methyltransferase [Pseudofrankia sp. BMG5.36]
MTTTPVFHLASLPAVDVLTLDGPEGRHAATVRRLRVGERLDVTDGAGGLAHCEVAAVRRDELDCRVLGRAHVPEPTPRIVVVQALAKGERGELAVEMLTEAGVDEIVPWPAARSVVRWEGERGARARARWVATAAEAAKQSRRARWPVVAEPARTTTVRDRLATAGLALVLHETATVPLAALPGRHEPWPPRGEIALVVGPEGGIADEELAVFEKAGATAVRLGPTVLRTSTAGVAAAAVLLAATGRWDG